MIAMTTSMLKHSMRSLRSGGLPLFFAVLMSALGLFSITAFSTLLWNFQTLARSVSHSVAAVAFLDVDSAAAAEEARATAQLLPNVALATLLTPEQSLARARRGLSGMAGLKSMPVSLDAAGLTMPWVIEVTPDVSFNSDPTAREALIDGMTKIDGVIDVAHPAGELKRVDALLRLMHGAGAFLAVLIGLVVVVVVSNAVRLTVLVRKEEIALQKLVGASDAFVAAPLLLSGIAQGGVGALLGVTALAVFHASIARVVKLALSGALGAFSFAPLPWPWLVLVVIAGSALGATGAGLSVWRYLREER